MLHFLENWHKNPKHPGKMSTFSLLDSRGSIFPYRSNSSTRDLFPPMKTGNALSVFYYS